MKIQTIWFILDSRALTRLMHCILLWIAIYFDVNFPKMHSWNVIISKKNTSESNTQQYTSSNAIIDEECREYFLVLRTNTFVFVYSDFGQRLYRHTTDFVYRIAKRKGTILIQKTIPREPKLLSLALLMECWWYGFSFNADMVILLRTFSHIHGVHCAKCRNKSNKNVFYTMKALCLFFPLLL